MNNLGGAASAAINTNDSHTLIRSIEKEEILSLYNSLNLEANGLSQEAFEFACKGYFQLLEKNVVSKDAYLVICDFSQSSSHKRFYLLDMADHKLLLSTFVAHGKNSGGEYATRFSNRPESLQSSLGFYITHSTYQGEHGLSLRLSGLEAGFNDNAEHRNIVVHGANYIGRGAMGRSYGCPALPKKESARIIKTIKNGSCLFIYHPSKNYLETSKILND